MSEQTTKSELAQLIDKMVDRFLRWELPKDFAPDSGIEFTEPQEIFTKIENANDNHWPVGTNLFDAQQAEEMIKYLLAVDDSERTSETVGEVSPLNTLVSTTAAEELPVELEIEGETMRFIAFPTKEGGWNCGYISEDLQTTFLNQEPFIKYETLEAAAKACKKALQMKGYLRP